MIYGIIVIGPGVSAADDVTGDGGQDFSPLAITISIALLIALFVSVILSPVLSDYTLKGGSEEDTKIVAILKAIYLRVLYWP